MEYTSMICPSCSCTMTHDERHLFLKCVCGYQIYSQTLVSREEILMGRDKAFPLGPYLEDNLKKLIYGINMLRALYAQPMVVTSGYRPAPFNQDAKGAGHSNHMVCLAVDIYDPDKKLMKYILENLESCKVLGLYFEDFRWTKNWVHCQVVPPASGKRIYVPNANSPTNPECWDGVYDSKYDS